MTLWIIRYEIFCMAEKMGVDDGSGERLSPLFFWNSFLYNFRAEQSKLQGTFFIGCI